LIDLQSDVREYFGWDESDDLESAQAMIQRVETSLQEKWARHNRSISLSKIFRRLVIRNPEVAILGAAIEPEEVVRILSEPTLIVAADGAAGVISEIPNSLSEKAWSRVALIVSDADGGEGTIEAVRRAVPLFLHAHGDNRREWESLLEFAEERASPPDLILTHQTQEKIPGMYNPGGFTDGDRAACILTALGVSRNRIRMFGTRTDVVGRWSGKTQEQMKMKKLQWMRRILSIQGLWED
jgi:uncharacterized Rossmann fold enzyme